MANPPLYNPNHSNLDSSESPPMAKPVSNAGVAAVGNVVDPPLHSGFVNNNPPPLANPTVPPNPPVASQKIPNSSSSQAFNPLDASLSEVHSFSQAPPVSIELALPNLDAENEDIEEETSNDYIEKTPSWLVSLVVHLILFIALGAYSFDPLGDNSEGNGGHSNLITTEDEEEIKIEEEEQPQFNIEQEAAFNPDTKNIEEFTNDSLIDEEAAPTFTPEPPDSDTLAGLEATLEPGDSIGNGFSGRGQRSKLAYAISRGATPGSQHAVALALKWLANHQNKDGSWNFDHRNKKCDAKCQNHGNAGVAKNAATAIALLPFLGAGETHKKGKYKSNVNDGLNYLIRSMRKKRTPGNLYETQGRMYSHGLATIALCEAYAMTKDYRLKKAAQSAINFTVQAQHRKGGWRYNPGDLGDTSVVGWQVMALKSGTLSGLKVPKTTFYKTTKFLDHVSYDKGASYGYTNSSRRTNATTSIGLLCRMYLGWKHDRPALVRGVNKLSETGPSKGDLYYNYYATQVMRHYGGEPWKKWNSVMRDYLVKTQTKKGHATGSWYLTGGHGSSPGGRLYCTAMSCMILEVYYRHLPIYSKESVAEGALEKVKKK